MIATDVPLHVFVIVITLSTDLWRKLLHVPAVVFPFPVVGIYETDRFVPLKEQQIQCGNCSTVDPRLKNRKANGDTYHWKNDQALSALFSLFLPHPKKEFLKQVKKK